MANQYYPGPGGVGRGGGPGPGGYGMRGRGMSGGGGPGPGRGHPMQGMMGHPQGPMGGGMMGHPGQQGGGMMKRGWEYDADPRGGYDYDPRGAYDMGMGPMGGNQQMMGGPPRRGPMPQAGRGISPSKVPHLDMMEETGAGPIGQSRALSGDNLSGPTGAVAVPVRFANDCEIIVTAKAQQQYAEMIEKEIRACDLKVDLMFPKPDVKIPTFIENIAAMGTIFAVVIRPDNENHRSVSVHVLRGPPKPEGNREHRNMPLTAAYQLIKARYLDLKLKEIGVIPDNIKKVLKCLLEDRPLTEVEYKNVIKFLQQRLRKQNAFEKRTNNIVTDGDSADDVTNTREAEDLQYRIMSQITGDPIEENPKFVEGEKLGDLVVPRPNQPLGALEAHADPKVQKAFDTLLNPSFLSNLNSAANQAQGGAGMGRGGGPFPRGQGQGFRQGGF